MPKIMSQCSLLYKLLLCYGILYFSHVSIGLHTVSIWEIRTGKIAIAGTKGRESGIERIASIKRNSSACVATVFIKFSYKGHACSLRGTAYIVFWIDYITEIKFLKFFIFNWTFVSLVSILFLFTLAQSLVELITILLSWPTTLLSKLDKEDKEGVKTHQEPCKMSFRASWFTF